MTQKARSQLLARNDKILKCLRQMKAFCIYEIVCADKTFLLVPIKITEFQPNSNSLASKSLFRAQGTNNVCDFYIVTKPNHPLDRPQCWLDNEDARDLLEINLLQEVEDCPT